ncbi:MAG: hypothetical protein HZC48_11150 [Nitrospirae bacterium]|nr:hypothetical protein [Nitrospirota bacterium]
MINPPDAYAYVSLTGEGKEERIVGVGRWFLTPDGKVFEERGFSISKRIHEGAYELIFNLKEQEEYAKRQAYCNQINGRRHC